METLKALRPKHMDEDEEGNEEPSEWEDDGTSPLPSAVARTPFQTFNEPEVVPDADYYEDPNAYNGAEPATSEQYDGAYSGYGYTDDSAQQQPHEEPEPYHESMYEQAAHDATDDFEPSPIAADGEHGFDDQRTAEDFNSHPAEQEEHVDDQQVPSEPDQVNAADVVPETETVPEPEPEPAVPTTAAYTALGESNVHDATKAEPEAQAEPEAESEGDSYSREMAEMANNKARVRPSSRLTGTTTTSRSPAPSPAPVSTPASSSSRVSSSVSSYSSAAPATSSSAAPATQTAPKKWVVETNYIRAGMRSNKPTTTTAPRSFSTPMVSQSSTTSSNRLSSAASTSSSSAVAASASSSVSSAHSFTRSSGTTSTASSASAPTSTAASSSIRARTSAASASASTESGDSDAELVVKRMIDQDESITWALFEYTTKLQVAHTGVGTVDDLRKHLDHTAAYYGYLRTTVGAEQRTKFVFLRWVGERVSPMTRAKFLNNEANVKKIIKIYHIEIPGNSLDEFVAVKVAQRLAKAAGANYDKSQNTVSVSEEHNQFGNYKGQSKDFFAQMERKGNVRSVEYVKHALPKTTPVDLSARQMTVGASINQKNLVLDVPGVDKERS